MTEKTCSEKLLLVQQLLKAPKGQKNNFGGYSFRSAEDILEAAKPLLGDQGLVLTISDEVVLIGDRYYVKATASIFNGIETISTVAYARESENKKGMEASMITGSTSSYARKYALNGLFAIDNNKDIDSMDNTSIGKSTIVKKGAVAAAKDALKAKKTDDNVTDEQIKDVKALMKTANVKVADMNAGLKSKYGVAKIELLSKKQASVIIDNLNKAIAKNKTA